MTNFIERNTKKSLAGRAFFGRHRRLIPLAVLMGLFSLIFAGRPDFLVRGKASGKQDFTGLEAAFKAAKQSKAARLAAFLREPASPARSSVALVAGKPLSGAASINGILDREQGREGELGVAVEPDAKDFFAGAAGAGDRRGDNIAMALAGTEPANVESKAKVGPSSGRLSRAQAAAISSRTRAALFKQRLAQGRKAFAQLADSRALQLSQAPPCSRGCAEYASGLTGAVYDGLRVKAGRPATLTAPLIEGAGLPSALNGPLPQQAYAQEAVRLSAASESCLRADERYEPEEKRLAAVLEARTKDFDASKRKRACLEYQAVRCQHAMACPLTAANGCAQSDCDG